MTLEKRIERLEERLKSRKRQPIPQDVIEEFLKYTNATNGKERTGNAVRYTRTHQSAPKPLQSKEACKQRHSEGLECTKQAISYEQEGNKPTKGENVPNRLNSEKGVSTNPSKKTGKKGGSVQGDAISKEKRVASIGQRGEKGLNVQNNAASPSTSQKLSTKRLNDAFGPETP